MQDGSAESFQELLEGIMLPSSLFEFDTNIFQAALVGKHVILGGSLCVSAPSRTSSHASPPLLAVLSPSEAGLSHQKT